MPTDSRPESPAAKCPVCKRRDFEPCERDGCPRTASAAQDRDERIPLDLYMSHAAFGAAYTARMMSENPDLSPEAVEAYKWAESEFSRIGRYEVGERDLTG